MDERSALLALTLVPGVGSARLHALLEAYGGSALRAWRSRATWGKRPGLPSTVAAAAASLSAKAVDDARRRLDELGARIVPATHPDYPPGLRHVAGPTPVLFVRGRLPADYRRGVAIVGTRRPTSGGERTSYEIASHLAAVGMVVVSGLALGVDGAAHRGALKTGGVTVAVLGCGLDRPYPRQHRDLMEEIAETGGVVTEYTLGTQPLPRHFPARNRLIAGLSAGVLLVESGRSGGALHTVNYALDAGREVMAVPGDVHRWQSEAPNELLRAGASLVRNAADVLHALGFTSGPARLVGGTAAGEAAAGSDASEDGLPRRLLALLAAEGPRSPDEAGAQLGVSVQEVAAALTWLEVTGRVGRAPGGRFRTVG